MALQLYRWRWQIELCFKRHKSLLDLEDVRTRLPETQESVLYAKLLVILWLDAAQARWEKRFLAAVSLSKAVMLPRWRMLRRLWASMKAAIGRPLTLEEWLTAPPEVCKRLMEAPRQRTRERNAQLCTFQLQIGGTSLC